MGEPFERLRAALSDRYILERELGAGGMATVFLAHDRRHNLKVSVNDIQTVRAGLGPEATTRPQTASGFSWCVCRPSGRDRGSRWC